jgi:hypothetical protein
LQQQPNQHQQNHHQQNHYHHHQQQQGQHHPHPLVRALQQQARGYGHHRRSTGLGGSLQHPWKALDQLLYLNLDDAGGQR